MPSCRPSITPFNPTLLGSVAGSGAAATRRRLSQIDGLVNLQALMISYIDDFKLMMVVTLLRHSAGVPAAQAEGGAGGARPRRAHGLISWASVSWRSAGSKARWRSS